MVKQVQRLATEQKSRNDKKSSKKKQTPRARTTHDTDARGRLYTQQSEFKDGNVQFPKQASFMALVEKELLSYPYGETDDIVDSISLALKYGGTGYDTTMSWV